MILELDGVQRDASDPPIGTPRILPEAQPLIWPRGEDGILRLAVLTEDTAPCDLSAIQNVVFAVRRYSAEANAVVALISRQATVTDAVAGLCEFDITQADTIGMLDKVSYFYDIQLTDADGRRWQLIPESEFKIDPIYARPGAPVTLPTGAPPLALGPTWLSYESGPDEIESSPSATEELAEEWEWNFDNITSSLANLYIELNCIARVSGGAGGTIRLRVGGTIGQPDGTVLVASDPVTGTSDAALFKVATVAKPVGRQRVVLTVQGAAGESLFMHGATIVARGAN